MLTRRLRRQPNIKSTLGQRFLFTDMVGYSILASTQAKSWSHHVIYIKPETAIVVREFL